MTAPNRRDILLVERLEELARTERAALEQGGFVVQVESSGRSALACLADRAFDLILLSDQLPDMTTGEFLASAATHPPAIPVLGLRSPTAEAQGSLGPTTGVIDWVNRDDAGHFTALLAWAADSCLRRHALVIDHERAVETLHGFQQRYRRLSGAVSDYIFTVWLRDGQAAETIHTPACEAVTGYGAEEFAADRYLWINMVVPSDRDVIREQAARVLTGEQVEPIEHRIRRKDNVVRWVRNTSVPHFDATGQLVSYDGLVQDVTERKQAGEALRQSEELFRTVAEFSSDFIFWHAPEGELLYVSPACEELTGYTPEELRNRDDLFGQLIHSPDCPHRNGVDGVVPGDGSGRATEFQIVTRGGDKRWVSHLCVSCRRACVTASVLAGFP